VSADERTDLLMSMTDEVGRLVYRQRQNDLIGTSRANAADAHRVPARSRV
jgi:glutamate dehydrogenase